MYLFLYTMLLVGGGALAHFRDYTTRNLYVREEPIPQVVEVDCPVCNNLSIWPPVEEECEIYPNGKSYKKCKYGTYENRACGNRTDCKRAPGAKCSSIMNQDKFDIQCAHGYYCDGSENRCTGGVYNPNVIDRYYLNPFSFSGSVNSRSTDLYNFRERRSAPYPFFAAPH